MAIEGTLTPQTLDLDNIGSGIRKSIKENLDKVIIALDENTQKTLEAEIKKEKEEEAFRQSQEKLNKLLNPSPLVKVKNKLTAEYDKWIVKNKFLKKTSDIFKGILSGLKGLASGGIGTFLETLFILALLGPKFAKSILSMVVNLIIMVAGIVIPMIPGVIRTFIGIIKDVLPPLAIQLIDSIFPMIGQAIDDLFRGSALFGIGEKFFGKNGILTTFFKGMAKFIPIFMGLLVAIKIFSAMMAINPVVAIIMGIALALFAFYEYGQQILDWISNLPNLLESYFGPVGRIFGVFFQVLYGPMKAIIQFIQDLKNGKGFLESLKNLFFNLLGAIIDGLLAVPSLILSLLWEVIKMGPSAAWSGIKWIGDMIWKGILFYIRIYKKVFTWIGKIFMKVIKFYINSVIKVFKAVFDVFTNPGKYLSMAKEGILKLGSKGAEIIGDVRAWFSKTLGEAFEWLQDKFYGFGELIADIIDHPKQYFWPNENDVAVRDERLAGRRAVRKMEGVELLRGTLSPDQMAELEKLKGDQGEQTELMLKYLKALEKRGKFNVKQFLSEPIDYMTSRTKSKKSANGSDKQ